MGERTPRLARRLGPALGALALVLALAACSSTDLGDPPGTAPTVTATPGTVPVTTPTVPKGIKDCGTADAISGWPTTTTEPQEFYRCIADALEAGTPAGMIVITPGAGESARQTIDGYPLPTRHIVTWTVLGKGRLRQVIDRRDEGGKVTTEDCTALDLVANGSGAHATGCKPA